VAEGYGALRDFLRRDDGQDLLEYALLAAAVGLASAVALSLLQATIGATYSTWATGTRNLWQMPGPGGGGT
jgi:Flp pilus assembly pilin Flp